MTTGSCLPLIYSTQATIKDLNQGANGELLWDSNQIITVSDLNSYEFLTIAFKDTFEKVLLDAKLGGNSI